MSHFLSNSLAQVGEVRGIVKVDNAVQAYAVVSLSTNPLLASTTESDGSFVIESVPFGDYTITATFVGFKEKSTFITLNQQNPSIDLNFNLINNLNALNEVVITGAKPFKRQTNSPVIVNLINSQ